MAGTEGVEPPLTEPESAVLPLDEVPNFHSAAAQEDTIQSLNFLCKRSYGLF